MALSDKDHETFLGLQSGHISDAMEGMGLTRSVLHGYTYLGTPGGRMVGTAYTVRQAPKHATASRTDPLVSHAKVSGGLASSGEVIVVDAGGAVDSGTWGENHCMRAKPNGVRGPSSMVPRVMPTKLNRSTFPSFAKGFRR